MNLSLKDADIQGVLVPAFFATPHPSAEVLKEARVGLHNLNCAVATILDQGISPHALKVDDLVSYIGGITPKAFCDSIMAAQKVARDMYDGTFDPPAILPIEKKLYSIVAIVLSEIGRRSDDINEYTVKRHFDEVFDLSAIDTVADFACWCLLIEYFEYSLREEKAVPITKFLKTHGSTLTTESRMMTFIKKNEFYDNSDVFADIFGITGSKPTLSQVAKLGFETFSYYKTLIEERNF